jgi:hypothetical protein
MTAWLCVSGFIRCVLLYNAAVVIFLFGGDVMKKNSRIVLSLFMFLMVLSLCYAPQLFASRDGDADGEPTKSSSLFLSEKRARRAPLNELEIDILERELPDDPLNASRSQSECRSDPRDIASQLNMLTPHTRHWDHYKVHSVFKLWYCAKKAEAKARNAASSKTPENKRDFLSRETFKV